MTAAAFGGIPTSIGGAIPFNYFDGRTLAATNTTLDASLEAIIMYGQIFNSDGGTHTIDTSGSSKMGFLTGASLVFANHGTALKFGLADMELGTGPAARAKNVTDTITFDVSKQWLGDDAHGMASSTWHEAAPDAGAKTIAHGDFVAFAVQMVTRGGATDLINVACGGTGTAPNRPGITNFTGGAYAAGTVTPNCFIKYSDGATGIFIGSYIFSTAGTTTNFNSGSSPNERGNLFVPTVPLKIVGIWCPGVNPAADFDVVLYSDPLGTPSAQKTISVDANAVGSANVNRNLSVLFPAAYSNAANAPVAAIIKPGGSNAGVTHVGMFAAEHNLCRNMGTNCYAVNRSGGSGAFAAQNSNKDIYNISLLVDQFDDGAGGAGGGGGSVNRILGNRILR